MKQEQDLGISVAMSKFLKPGGIMAGVLMIIISVMLAIIVVGLAFLWRFVWGRSPGARRPRRGIWGNDYNDWWGSDDQGYRGDDRGDDRKTKRPRNRVYDFSMPDEMHDFTSSLREEGARELGFRRKKKE